MTFPPLSLVLLDPIDVATVIFKHIWACRRIPGLEQALAIVTVESNQAHIASQVQDRVIEMGLKKTLFLMEDHRGKGPYRDMPGSVTTEKNKVRSVEALRDLYLKTGNIRFHKHFVTTYWEISLDPNNRLSVRDTLVQHLRNFKMKRIPRKDHGGSIIYELYYSGKWTGDKNDDFVSGLLITLTAHYVFWLDEEKKYRQYQLMGEQ